MREGQGEGRGACMGSSISGGCGVGGGCVVRPWVASSWWRGNQSSCLVDES